MKKGNRNIEPLTGHRVESDTWNNEPKQFHDLEPIIKDFIPENTNTLQIQRQYCRKIINWYVREYPAGTTYQESSILNR